MHVSDTIIVNTINCSLQLLRTKHTGQRLNQRIKNRFSAELCCAICPLSSCSCWFSVSQEETSKMDIKTLRNKLPFSLSLHLSLTFPPSLSLFPPLFSPSFSTLFHSCMTITAATGKQYKYQA